MEPFIRLTTIAVPFLEDGIDTDVIFPARFLLIMEKAGLGRYLFHDRRAAAGDKPFVLDQARYAGAGILIAGQSFGCGSSREQAVWALVGAGLRCVIAPSFGDIFYANCFKNGLLPVTLAPADVAHLARLAEEGRSLTVDLVDGTVTAAGEPPLPFAITPDRREALLEGRDEIDRILLRAADIAAFEADRRRTQPWIAAQEPAALAILTNGTLPT